MTKTIKTQLYGATLERLKAICEELELPRFAHKQIAKWLYSRFVTDIDAMTDLSKAARETQDALRPGTQRTAQGFGVCGWH